MSTQVIIALISAMLGSGASAIGIVKWFSTSQRTRYRLEFRVDELEKEIQEIKTLANLTKQEIHQVSIMVARIESQFQSVECKPR